MDIFVSPKNIRNDSLKRGSEGNPASSLAEALDLVKEAVREGLSAPLTVRLAEGEYRTDGLVMGEEASGTPEHPVILKRGESA